MSRPPSIASLDLDRLDALLRRALVFNHIDDAMIVTTSGGVIMDWNIGAERIFGWPREEVLGETFEIFLDPANVPELTRRLLEAVAREGRWSGEFGDVRKGGTVGRCEAVSVPLLDGAGTMLGILNALVEVSERLVPATVWLQLPVASVALLTSQPVLLGKSIDPLPEPTS